MNNTWYVYLVRCSDNSLYCGITNNLESRIATHNLGKGSKYCRSRLPVKLVYHESSENRSTASVQEYQIKQLSKSCKEDLVSSKFR